MNEKLGKNTEQQELQERQELGEHKNDILHNIEAQERQVKESVWNKNILKARERGEYSKGIEVKLVKQGIFAVKSNDTGNISLFVDNNGEIIIGLGAIIKRPYIKNGKAFESAGYIEKKENGLDNMYKIIGVKNGEPLLDGPIDIFSKEYYQAWLDILFYADIYNKLWRIKHNMENNTKISIEYFIEGGSFKFEDLEIFKNKGMITEEIFEYGKEEIRKKLLEQIADKRLDNLGAGENPDNKYVKIFGGIFLRNLDDYLKKGYIDQNLYNQGFIKLTEVGKITADDIKLYLEKGKIDSNTVKKCYEYLK